MREDSADYRTLFLGSLPLMDVRAPAEFSKGAFPGAINLPLMNDMERQKVGTCYKQRGPEAALAMGHSLVSGRTRAERIEAWSAFARANPQGYLYCFRGGLRSKIAQAWLQDAGIPFPRVVGGYKAMRTFLMETIEAAIVQCDFVLLGGLTGTGKTEVLTQLDHALDLEHHANHRGSSFGKQATPQPSQIDFENALAIDLLKQRAAGGEQFVIEDEGHIIGSCSVPLTLYQRMQQCPLVWLEDSLASRVGRILGDYVIDLRHQFIERYGEEQGVAAHAERLRQSLDSIARRLGGERAQRLMGVMDAALDEQDRSGAVDLHRGWIEGLLREYYDPMYAFQRQRKEARIEFSGGRREVLEYLRQRLSRQR
jgi:tRNA 2-selenouridine synthase